MDYEVFQSSSVARSKGKGKAVETSPKASLSKIEHQTEDIQSAAAGTDERGGTYIYYISSGPSKKTKGQMKADKAYDKRAAKYREKKKLQEQKVEEEIAKGKTICCPSCGGTDHLRASNKLCKSSISKRKTTTDLKRTLVIKTSLSGSCRNPSFISVVQETVKYIHDITYIGSLFANFYSAYLDSQNQTLLPITHELCYDFFAVIATEGKRVSESVRTVFNVFQTLTPSLDASKFRKKGLMALLSSSARQYAECIRNHVVANFRRKTIQYLLIVLSDEADERHEKSLTVQEQKIFAEHIYERVAGENPVWPKALPQTEELQSRTVEAVESILSYWGDEPVDDKTLNAKPHVYLPWMFHVLDRMERKVFVIEEKPIRLSKENENSLKEFITQTITAIDTDCFKPEKYTDPKGSRRFSILPVYSFQVWHIALDGVDVEFVFKKHKPPYDLKYKPTTPADLQHMLPDAIVWDVDPGVTDIFVATDNAATEKHRLRRTSTKEYYDLCGYNRATQRRKQFLASEPLTKTIIDKIPTVETANTDSLVSSITYRLQHHNQITEFYDREMSLANQHNYH
ncbi:hypothetical protein DFQ28_010232 [Apophysomyces sp. BC1034]|nr:hypothetical protein DFQ28_010232 [Apophysomyces sp. BC1034]